MEKKRAAGTDRFVRAGGGGEGGAAKTHLRRSSKTESLHQILLCLHRLLLLQEARAGTGES